MMLSPELFQVGKVFLLRSLLTRAFIYTRQVVLDGEASDPVQVLSCVPQGLVLGQILFLIFINDLQDNIRSFFVCLQMPVSCIGIYIHFRTV